MLALQSRSSIILHGSRWTPNSGAGFLAAGELDVFMSEDGNIPVAEGVAEVGGGTNVGTLAAGGGVGEPDVPVWAVFVGGAAANCPHEDVLDGEDGSGGQEGEGEEGSSELHG
ncbi:MAG: hypothetical protein M1834_001639 [Cirrosporium novae-zelandiae]|nr:MAG: hypothetical protein M1834_004156 [Cirrosporium novae-zelandiae]KAI9735623.1 MAG: hypothetical protein M1834_001639 [Cirrosporium novae-zelandiae]